MHHIKILIYNNFNMFTKAQNLKPKMATAEYNETSIFMYLFVNYELFSF
jgi:hypothetical protein